MKVVVYIAAERAWTMPPEEVERLQHRFPDDTFVYARDEAEEAREIADAEIAFTSILNRTVLASARRLRWIHSPAAGVGRLMYPDLAESPVIVTNSRGMHAVAIAEHVIGVMIALTHHLHLAIRFQARRHWTKDDMPHARILRGRQIGIVGLGAIGTAVGETASALGMRVVGLKKHVDEARPDWIEKVWPPSQLPELLASSDVVVLTAPLTPETRGLIGSRELRLMRRDAILINVARGKLVRERELIRELQAGTIAGAGLDVFEHEPLDPDSPLWDLSNVIVTPHMSGFFEGYWQAVTDLFAANLLRFHTGQPLMNVVDKRAGY